ncbi:hypothetical protein ACJX0J_029241, partial [Zea mays]
GPVSCCLVDALGGEIQGDGVEEYGLKLKEKTIFIVQAIYPHCIHGIFMALFMLVYFLDLIVICFNMLFAIL